MEDKINFIAKHGKWIAVKKMEIDENTDKIVIARLLLSIRETAGRKLFEYLDEDFDLEELDDIVSDTVPKGTLSGGKIAEALKKLKYSVPRKVEGSKLEKKIKKQIVTEKVLQELKFKTLDADTLEKYIKKKETRKAFD
ncbi:MAG: DUF2666 family protein [Euryarchaeota archaeon]|nr:DUF2666 family protein [Euryarchaeota archaeon]